MRIFYTEAKSDFLGVFVLVVPASRLKHRPITREEVTTSLHRDAEKPKEAVDWFDIFKKMLMRITKKGKNEAFQTVSFLINWVESAAKC